MRLAVVALSTVLLSGCSWMGSGGGYGYGDSYSYGQGGSGAYGCAPAGGAAYGNQAYGFQGGGAAGCASGAGYNVAYGGAGGGMYGGGAGMYGAGAGAYGAGSGLRGAYGVNGYGTGLQSAGGGMYGAGAGTGAGMYGAGAGAGMYGAGAGAGMYGAGTGAGMYGAGTGAGAGMYGAGAGMYGAGTGAGAGLYGAGTGAGLYGAGNGITTLGGANGMYSGYGTGLTTLGGAAPYGSALGGVQTLANGGTVQTVTGAPIYVPQPYPAYYSAGSGYYGGGYQTGGFGGALPFGLELGGGQDFAIDGNIFPGEKGKTDATSGLTVSDLDAISYDDAWGKSKGADLTATYDVSPNTTLLARAGYNKADGNLIQTGTVGDGLVTEDFFVEYSDLEQYTLEGGFRHYMGQPRGMRPYVGATAGFTKTEDVTVSQSSATLVDPTVFTQTYVDGGWSPTASGVVGAEWAMGARSAIGVETGIRWTEALDSNFISDDRISVPVRLRGRLSF